MITKKHTTRLEHVQCVDWQFQLREHLTGTCKDAPTISNIRVSFVEKDSQQKRNSLNTLGFIQKKSHFHATNAARSLQENTRLKSTNVKKSELSYIFTYLTLPQCRFEDKCMKKRACAWQNVHARIYSSDLYGEKNWLSPLILWA